MKKLFFLVSFSLFLLPLVNAQTENPNTQKQNTQTQAQKDDAQNKARIEYSTPGEMHKWMSRWAGTWTGDANSYAAEQADPSVSATTANYKMLYNGLYQVNEFKGTMNGQPYEGQSILAYDNAKKQFVNIVLDNSGSGIGYYTGTLDPTTKVLTLKGTQYDPLTQKDIPVRQEIRFLNDDSQTITFYGPGTNGKEYKTMDIKLTRNKER
jgi:hypothetical protein